MKRNMLISLVLALCLLLTACARVEDMPEPTQAPTADIPFEPDLPDTIRIDENGVPVMNVYVVEEERVVEMNIENYLCGVLAGEMKNDWPLEALKAQAILARTFVIKFLSEKQSKYEGADISTDIEEAQAYNEKEINERVREAVEATRGLVLCYESEPIYAWFHSHSGGKTATAQEGLSYQEEAPYTQMVDSMEDDTADQEAAAWKAEFSQEEVIAAAQAAGVKVGDTIESVSSGEAGESGRLKSIRINGMDVPANEFRIAIGSSKMRSTFLTDIQYENGTLSLSGKGYGHGVGMSQWGAYAMAEKGEKAENIIHHYFHNVDIVQKWK